LKTHQYCPRTRTNLYIESVFFLSHKNKQKKYLLKFKKYLMLNFLFFIYRKAESIPPKIAKTNIKPYKETKIKVKIPKNL
jgi:hypothetical protein